QLSAIVPAKFLAMSDLQAKSLKERTYADTLAGHLGSSSVERVSSENLQEIFTAQVPSFPHELRLFGAPGVTGFTFDNMGRLTGTTTAYTAVPSQTFAIGYSYDAASNRTGFTDPQGRTIAYGYDSLNRATDLTDSLAGH